MTYDAKHSIVVTGAGSGIGRAIAELLVDTGWFVVGVDNDEISAESVRSSFHERGSVVVGDVARLEVLEEAAAVAVRAAPLGGWVNNAAVSVQTPLLDLDPPSVDRIVEVNLRAVLLACGVAARAFASSGSRGAIVNISSVHGRAGFTGWLAYDATKGAVEALTRTAAVELGPANIRVNAVAPGSVRTPNMERHAAASGDPARFERELAATAPLQRLAEPTEIARVVNFLLSDESSFVTGHTLVADGGLTAACTSNVLDPLVARLFPEMRT